MIFDETRVHMRKREKGKREREEGRVGRREGKREGEREEGMEGERMPRHAHGHRRQLSGVNSLALPTTEMQRSKSGYHLGGKKLLSYLTYP